MSPFRIALIAAVAATIATSPALAQNVINFSTDVEQADGVATPTLTWSTSPPASSCVASGQWSGEKGPAGQETLPPTTSSTTYNLTCSWTADDRASLSWSNPTQNTDGSPYTDPGSLRIAYGVDGARDLVDTIPDPATTSRVIQDLAPGQWCFTIFAVNQRGVSSVASNEACKTITGAVFASDSVGVVVNPVPAGIQDLAVE